MRHTIKVISIGVVVVLSIAFASYMVLGPFRPEEELRRMLLAMSRVETVTHLTGMSWTRQADNQRSTSALYSRGQIHLPSKRQMNHGTRFRVVRLAETARAGELAGEIRHIDQKTYLTYAPPGPDVPGVDFGKEHIWVAFESGELPAWGSLLPGVNFPLFEEGRERTSWHPDAIEKLRDLLARADVFDVTFDEETAEIDGVQTRVFDATFDVEALRAFLFEYVRAKEGRDPNDRERIRIDEQVSALERITMRMWIGVDDHLLYRFQAAGAVPTQSGGSQLVPVDMLIKFSDYNAPFEVEPPEKTIAFSELLQEAFGILPEAQERAFGEAETDGLVGGDEARLPSWGEKESPDPDGDGLDNIAESFFGTDQNNPDTDGDGVNDGDEVGQGTNPLGKGRLFGFGLD